MKPEKRTQFRPKSQVALIVACGVLTSTALAQTNDVRELELSAGYARSDNVFRVAQNESDTNFSVVGLRVNWNVERPKYDFAAVGDLDYFFYSDSRIEDRPDGDLDLRLNTQLVPNVLSWFVTNNFSQIRQNIILGNQPDNLDEINVLSSGVVLDVPLGNRTTLSASVGASDRHVDSPNDLDSEEISAGFGIYRQFRSRSRIGLIAGIRNVKYDDALSTEYDIERVAIRYESQLASGDVDIQIGANRLNDDMLSEKGDIEPLVQVDWVRDVGARSQLGISAGHRIAELGGSISARNPGQVVVPPSGQFNATPVPFRDTNLSVFINTSWNRATLSGSVLFSQQLFDSDTIEDASTVGSTLSWVRTLSNTLSLGLDATFSRREAIRAETVSDDIFAGISLTKELGRRFSVSASYRLNDRDSDIGETYTENVYRVDFAWLVLR